MKDVIETSQIIKLDEIMIGDVRDFVQFMSQLNYLILELTQIDNHSTRLYISNDLDNRDILILTFGN